MWYPFLLLILVSGIALLVGLINPKRVVFFGTSTRLRAIAIYLTLFVIGFIGVGKTYKNPFLFFVESPPRDSAITLLMPPESRRRETLRGHEYFNGKEKDTGGKFDSIIATDEA